MENDEPLPATRINPKTNPGIFQSCSGADQNDGVFTLIDNILFAWKIFRHTNKDKSIWPRFSGLVALLFKKESSERTVLPYLPPIPKPISEYSTTIEIFYQSRQLAKQCDMQYVHIVMDVGAAMKAYQVVRNNPLIWFDILIHPGDFHAMMMFFSVIGNYLQGSGFEEIVFQAKMCTSGSIKAVMNGKQYNRCWSIHEAFAESIEQLFMKEFMEELSFSVDKMSDDLFKYLETENFKFIQNRETCMFKGS